jgi:hypothetical protein
MASPLLVTDLTVENINRALIYLSSKIPSSGTSTAVAPYVDTAANLAASNPTLKAVQIGYETDTKFFKIGDGATAYNSLMYQIQRTLMTAYTPNIVGFGTPTGVSFSWIRFGNMLKVLGQFTSGTSTATEARIGFPGSIVSDSIPSIQVCMGTIGISNAAAWSLVPLIESGVGYITIGIQSAGTASLTKLNGSTILSAGQKMSIAFEVPASGWNV